MRYKTKCVHHLLIKIRDKNTFMTSCFENQQLHFMKSKVLGPIQNSKRCSSHLVVSNLHLSQNDVDMVGNSLNDRIQKPFVMNVNRKNMNYLNPCMNVNMNMNMSMNISMNMNNEFDDNVRRRHHSNQVRQLSFIPRKAPVSLTPASRTYFKALLDHKIRSEKNDGVENDPIVGIMLKYQQSLTGQPRMVFTFEFVTDDELHDDDEGYGNFLFLVLYQKFWKKLFFFFILKCMQCLFVLIVIFFLIL